MRGDTRSPYFKSLALRPSSPTLIYNHSVFWPKLINTEGGGGVWFTFKHFHGFSLFFDCLNSSCPLDKTSLPTWDLSTTAFSFFFSFGRCGVHRLSSGCQQQHGKVRSCVCVHSFTTVFTFLSCMSARKTKPQWGWGVFVLFLLCSLLSSLWGKSIKTELYMIWGSLLTRVYICNCLTWHREQGGEAAWILAQAYFSDVSAVTRCGKYTIHHHHPHPGWVHTVGYIHIISTNISCTAHTHCYICTLFL